MAYRFPINIQLMIFASIILSLNLAFAAPQYGTGICEGLIVDEGNYPMTGIPKPGYLSPMTDPEFGTKIIRITDVGSKRSGDSAVIKPVYSTVPAWNSDESLILLWERGYGHLLYDGKTYEPVNAWDGSRHMDIAPSDLEHVYWSTTDPDILYYPESRYNSGWIERLIEYDVRTGQKTTIHDFAADDVEGYTFGFGSDPMFSSWDSDVFGFTAANDDDGVFIYRRSDDTILYSDPDSYSNAPMPSPNGEYFYLDGKIYDTQFNLVKTIFTGAAAWEHASMGELLDGSQKYFSVQFDNYPNVGNLIMTDMLTGEEEVIIGEKGFSRLYPLSGTHISAVAHKNPGMVAVSIVGYAADGQSLLDNEILLVDANTGQVCRVAHHHSRERIDYWGEPHATISPSGTRILFGSDWGNTESVETYVVELPSYDSAADTSTPGEECHLLSSSLPVPSSFGASFNVLSDNKETILKNKCNDNSVELIIDNSKTDETMYIWKQAYYTTDGKTWKSPVNFQGTYSSSGKWVIGNAHSEVSLTPDEMSGINYFGAYICFNINNVWKCGCHDSACTNHMWNVQAFRKD